MRPIFAVLPILTLLAGCIDIPEGSDRGRPGRQSTASYTPSPEERQCLAKLGATDANFTPVPNRYLDKGCTLLNSVRLSSLRSDTSNLELSNLGPVTCPVANTFAAWARFGVDRAARQILGSKLVRIETMGSYNCRNVAGTSRRSAHSTGDAIDISGFVLADGRRITILGDWTSGSPAERRFLEIVHKSACKRFGTVLGPEYNAAHRDHFHLEYGDGSYCR